MATQETTPAAPDVGTPPAAQDSIESRLQQCYTSHPEVLQLRASSNTVVEFRSVIQVSSSHFPSHYTASTLTAPGLVSIPPFVIVDNVQGNLLAFYHLGPRVAGHVNLLHGGVAMTLLDECLGRATLGPLPKHTAVTANLNVDFRRPVPLERVVFVRAVTTRVEGRKAWVEGALCDAESGVVYVEAKGLFVQPKDVEGFESIVSGEAARFMT